LIGGATNYFSNEVGLTQRNHVSETWDGIEHLANFFILYSIFLDLGDQDLEDLVYAAVEEDLKLIQLCLV
jgi:hypothetical protein